MKILLNNIDLNEALMNVSNLGFVPTMGSLHNGHISLIKKSKKKCKKTIVSIFVNPTQFNNKIDYEKYPRNQKKDLSILKKLKIDFLYLPKKKDIYNFQRQSKIILNKKNKIMCAKYRKGHFEGVIDVMDRLTNLIKPKIIFMGEKDYQQVYLVKHYLKKRYNSTIISCETIRDKNKIALSSRNLFLKNKHRKIASNLAKNLLLFKKELKKKKNIKKQILLKKKELIKLFGIKIDYLELRKLENLRLSTRMNKSKLFIAYHLNKVRLIDNF